MTTLDKVLFLAAIVIIAVAGYFVWQGGHSQSKCLNGKAQCEISGWQTITDTQQGISYQYPDPLATTYITAQTWPPSVTLVSGTSTCSVEPFVIDGLSYCVSAQTDGAAGSVYTAYDYSVAMPKIDKTVEVEFALRSVQCANYDDPQKTACDTERTSLNVDNLVSQIISTIQTI